MGAWPLSEFNDVVSMACRAPSVSIRWPDCFVDVPFIVISYLWTAPPFTLSALLDDTEAVIVPKFLSLSPVIKAPLFSSCWPGMVA